MTTGKIIDMIKKTAPIILFILISAVTFAHTIIQPARSMKEFVKKISSDKKYCKKLKITEAELLAGFYRKNNYKLQWYSGKQGIKNREMLLNMIRSNEFMSDINYASIKLPGKKCFTRQDTLLNEIRMTDLALYLFKDVAFSHQSFVKYNGENYHPDCINFVWLLEESLQTGDFKKQLVGCEPESDQYQQLKANYRRLYDSLNSIRYTTVPDHALKKIKKRLEKIKYAADLYRWISCVQYKNCFVINLATKKLNYTECGTEIFTCNVITENLSTMAGSIKNLLFYYDAQYPSNLRFEFANPFNISLCSLPVQMANHNATREIHIEKAGELAEILGIDVTRLPNNVCQEEATPFVKIPAKFIPLFIVNVPMDF